MLTFVFSGPIEASEAATATLTFVGKRAIASLALPLKTVCFSVCKRSEYTAEFFKEFGPFQ